MTRAAYPPPANAPQQSYPDQAGQQSYPDQGQPQASYPQQPQGQPQASYPQQPQVSSSLIPIKSGPAAVNGQQQQDPPGRVARVQYMSGQVSMQPGGVNDWIAATQNRPLTTPIASGPTRIPKLSSTSATASSA